MANDAGLPPHPPSLAAPRHRHGSLATPTTARLVCPGDPSLWRSLRNVAASGICPDRVCSLVYSPRKVPGRRDSRSRHQGRRQVAWPTTDEGRDLGIEQRIAAAAHASMMAANSVQSCIALEVGAMASAWQTAAAEADELEAQAAAVDAFARVYKEQLARLVEVFPDGRPVNTNAESLPSTVLSRRPDGNWVVADQITARLDRDFRAAQDAVREASGRRFAGKQREQAKRMTEAVQSTIRALEAHASRLRDARTQELQARAAGADRSRASADERLRGELATLSDAVRRLPPAMVPWANPSWRSWTPTLTHSHVLLGMLRPQFNQAPGSNHGFAQDVRTPAFLPIREAVRLSHRRQDRDTTLALSRSIVLRALACTPPGKLRLSVFDPTGLGQSVAPLLELGEYDRELIGGKIWSSTDDLRRLLAEHAAHIELVIQKYLRAEYATLDEFNAAAGAIAEPYRLLVVFDAPAGFDEPVFAELRRVIENGPRCGVATLLVTNEDVTVAATGSRSTRFLRRFGRSACTFRSSTPKARVRSCSICFPTPTRSTSASRRLDRRPDRQVAQDSRPRR